jgi:hypothetical protein
MLTPIEIEIARFAKQCWHYAALLFTTPWQRQAADTGRASSDAPTRVKPASAMSLTCGFGTDRLRWPTATNSAVEDRPVVP